MRSSRRARLLEAATTLFARRGFRGAGIDAILEEAKVARMTLYHHFGSKEQLVRDVLDLHEARVVGAYSAAMADVEDPRARIRAAFEHLATELANQPPGGDLFLRYAFEGDGDASANEVVARYRGRMRELFEAPFTELGAAEPGEHAESILALIDAARVSALMGGGDGAAKRALAMADMVIDAAT
ncbi:MAG: TetR/AcrR family transcriptional regulator [Myxococcales bacterium]|nr:TetR/AcrR family transcriptional regulator [Myxococcales bacterium]